MTCAISAWASHSGHHVPHRGLKLPRLSHRRLKPLRLDASVFLSRVIVGDVFTHPCLCLLPSHLVANGALAARVANDLFHDLMEVVFLVNKSHPCVDSEM